MAGTFSLSEPTLDPPPLVCLTECTTSQRSRVPHIEVPGLSPLAWGTWRCRACDPGSTAAACPKGVHSTKELSIRFFLRNTTLPIPDFQAFCKTTDNVGGEQWQREVLTFLFDRCCDVLC